MKNLAPIQVCVSRLKKNPYLNAAVGITTTIMMRTNPVVVDITTITVRMKPVVAATTTIMMRTNPVVATITTIMKQSGRMKKMVGYVVVGTRIKKEVVNG